MGRKRLRKWLWVNTLCRQSRTWPPPFRTSCKSSICFCWLSCNTLPVPWNPWRCSARCTAFSQTCPRLRSRDPAAAECPDRRSAAKAGNGIQAGNITVFSPEREIISTSLTPASRYTLLPHSRQTESNGSIFHNFVYYTDDIMFDQRGNFWILCFSITKFRLKSITLLGTQKGRFCWEI